MKKFMIVGMSFFVVGLLLVLPGMSKGSCQSKTCICRFMWCDQSSSSIGDLWAKTQCNYEYSYGDGSTGGLNGEPLTAVLIVLTPQACECEVSTKVPGSPAGFGDEVLLYYALRNSCAT